MAGVSTYLNFDACAEQALLFYAEVFRTELTSLTRMGDMPGGTADPPLTEAELHLVAHGSLPILGGHVLMATDLLTSQGHRLRLGNNMTINLDLDERAETERLFAALSDGGSEAFGLLDMPWNSYWGTCADRFGVRWMFNCAHRAGDDGHTAPAAMGQSDA